MASFDISFNKVMEYEGIYSYNPRDPGGETFYGISRRNNPAWVGWEYVDRLSKPNNKIYGNIPQELIDLVKEFYKKNYWKPLKLEALHWQNISDELFDIAVNMGTKYAGKFLQKSLNLMNRNGKDWPNIVEDGVIGPKTLKALREAIRKRGADLIVTLLNHLQAKRYIELCEINDDYKYFLNGWLKRT